MKGARAFTLIELLVVIAVIAVLMGVLLPSLSMARMQAKRVASTSNVRQIGMAMELYTEDNRGFFPEISHGLNKNEARERSWVFTLSKYLGDVNEVRVCPADPQRRERLEHGASSYVMNEYIALDAKGAETTGTRLYFRVWLACWKLSITWPSSSQLPAWAFIIMRNRDSETSSAAGCRSGWFNRK